VLLAAALLAGIVLLALAWRDGLPDYQCGCSCARDGTPIPPEEHRARINAFDDRGRLLVWALVASAVAVGIAIPGIVGASGARLLYASGLVGGAAIGVGAIASVFVLVPYLGY
jgi:hypothetical protein